MTTAIDKAVQAIWNDLTDRRGIKHELTGCDPEIQEEIRGVWRRQIQAAVEAEREACAKIAEGLHVDRQAYVMGGIGRVMVQLPRDLAAAIRARGGK